MVSLLNISIMCKICCFFQIFRSMQTFSLNWLAKGSETCGLSLFLIFMTQPLQFFSISVRWVFKFSCWTPQSCKNFKKICLGVCHVQIYCVIFWLFSVFLHVVYSECPPHIPQGYIFLHDFLSSSCDAQRKFVNSFLNRC